jgi:hypothetical protein
MYLKKNIELSQEIVIFRIVLVVCYTNFWPHCLLVCYSELLLTSRVCWGKAFCASQSNWLVFSRLTDIRGCQMAYFRTRNPNLGKFWRNLELQMFIYSVCHYEYFTALWYILWHFGNFCGYLVHDYPLWYVLPRKIRQPSWHLGCPDAFVKSRPKCSSIHFL